MADVKPAPSGRTRVSLIGLGEAGATIHLPALRGMPELEIVGAADLDQKRRADVSSRHGIPVFADPKELLSAARSDLVIVASPPALHAAHCIAAMESGADVLSEKPFAASVREGQQVVERAAALGRRVAVNHEFRAMPIFRELIAAVRRESTGPTVVNVWQQINHSPAGESGWRGALRRRSLYEAGVHLIDVTLRLFDETPRAVSATFSSGGGDHATDAIVLVTLEFSRGRLAQLVQCRVHRGDRQYLEVRADTSGDSFRASFGGRARLTAGLLRSPRPHVAVERGASGIAWRERGASRTVFARNGGAPMVTSTREVIRAFMNALRSGGPVPFAATEGVETLRVVAAAYRSAEQGRTVSLHGPDREEIESMPLAESLRP